MGTLGSLVVKIVGDNTSFNKSIAATQAQLNRSTKGLQTVAKNISGIGMSMTKGLTVPLVAIGAAATKSAIDFESAFAGVRKTVNATEEEFGTLEKGIRDMAKRMPASASEIAKVAEAAGQLGIKTENILDFTETMINLGESTNLSADQASTSLARLANITQMPQSAFDRLGSTIVALGNNFATTESEITEMALRLAGAGKQIGLAESDIMGLSAALSSVGIEAEAGGSAFSKLMIAIQLAVETGNEDLNNFAEVAGMSASEFQKAFKEDAAGALIAFIEGLGKSEEKGTSAIKVLDDMEISEVRLRDALLRASGASDVFTEAIELGSKAWDENTALTEEAEKRYATSESQLIMLKNKIVDLGISLGGSLTPIIRDNVIPILEKFINFIDGVIQEFVKLPKPVQNVILGFGGLVAASGPTLVMLSKIITTTINLRSSILLLNTALKSSILMAAPIVALLAEISGAMLLTGDSMQRTDDAYVNLSKSINDMELALKKYDETAKTHIKVSGEVKLEDKELYEENINLLKTIEALGEEYPAIVKETDKLTSSYYAHEISLQECNDGLKELINTREEHKNVEKTAEEVVKEYTDALLDQGYTQERATELANAAAKEMGHFADETEGANDEAEGLKQTIDDLIASFYKYYNLNQSVTEATWKYEDAMANLDKVMKDANATERDKQAAIFGAQDALEELQIAMAKELSDTNISIERKKELQDQYIRTGLEAVNTGVISEEAFMSMAAQFGISKEDIVKAATDMDSKLDWATRERFIHISHNMSGVESDVDRLYNKLKQIDGMTVTYKMVQTGLMGAYKQGGIVGYKEGALIDKIASASKGINIPRFDDGGVLAMLHPPEVVLNPKQALNLVWNMANRRETSSPSINYDVNITSPKPLSETEIRRQIDLLTRELGYRMGI